MVATTTGTAGYDNQGEYSEQKNLKKKSEIKRSKKWGWEKGKTEVVKLRKHKTIHSPQVGEEQVACPCFLL